LSENLQIQDLLEKNWISPAFARGAIKSATMNMKKKHA